MIEEEFIEYELYLKQKKKRFLVNQYIDMLLFSSFNLCEHYKHTLWQPNAVLENKEYITKICVALDCVN